MDERIKKIKGIACFGILIILGSFWCGNKYQQWNNVQQSVDIIEIGDEIVEPQDVESVEESNLIYVHVAGAVQQSGVYQLQEGQRVEDALALAGILPDALVDEYLNRASILQDGQKIVVPSVQDINVQEIVPVMAGAIYEDSNGKVNINRADQGTLESLAGIGPAKATAIIQYRESMGGFKTIDELKSVKGIGDKTFESLKSDITV